MNVELSARTIEARARIHAALGDPLRLRLVELLAPSDRTPSDVALQLDIGSNLLAHHLRILESAGIVERLASEGDGRRTYLRLVGDVATECGIGTPTFTAGGILFICTGNSARSQLAAAMWNQGSEVPAESAGTHPAADVHPLAVRAGRAAGLDLRAARPRAIEDVATVPELVVTVCDRAHEELTSLPAEAATVLHWWIPDPRVVGTPAAFEESVRLLRRRVDAFRPHVLRARRRPGRRHRP